MSARAEKVPAVSLAADPALRVPAPGVIDMVPKARAETVPASSSRGAPLRFWIFAAVILSCLVIAVVSLDSLLVQTDYTIRTAQTQVAQMQADHDVLVNQVSQLSSPSRVAAWAVANGLVEPKAAVILKIMGAPKKAVVGGVGG